jgi:drug/metabolite transporter (DMT)-like permease
MTALSRIASQTAPVSIIVFFQNLISWVLVAPWIAKYGFSSLRTKRFGLISFRSVTGLVGFATLFLAAQRIPLVDSILLYNSAPIFIPFVLWIWLKVPIDHKLWPGILVGLMGIILILKPGKEIFDLGALFGLCSSLSLSLIMVSIQLLAKTEKDLVVLFYYFLIASILSLPFAIYFWVPLTQQQWMEVIGIGIFSILGQWSFMRAFHYQTPAQLGPFCYMAVVYSVLIQWALWNHLPDFFVWGGIFLVCAGSLWTLHSNSQSTPH